MATNRRLSAGESKEIARRAEAGESVTQLSVKFGIARPTVYRAIEKHGSAGAKGKSGKPVGPLAIRLEAHEIAAIDRLAQLHKVSRSAMARRILRRAVDYNEPDPEVLDAIRDLSRQIKMVGGNLNQIAAHLNREARMLGRASVSAQHWREVERCERDLKAFVRQIDDLFLYAAKRRRARNADILNRETRE